MGGAGAELLTDGCHCGSMRGKRKMILDMDYRLNINIERTINKKKAFVDNLATTRYGWIETDGQMDREIR